MSATIRFLCKRLNFFEKDEIEWNDHVIFSLYKKLNNLKNENSALWNGNFGGSFIRLKNDNSKAATFLRSKYENKVLVIANLSNQTIDVNIENDLIKGFYTNVIENDNVELGSKESFNLSAWGYIVFAN